MVVKTILEAVNPLNIDVRNRGNEPTKVMGLMWTKRTILSGLGLTGLVLAILAVLAFTGILPGGIVTGGVLGGLAAFTLGAAFIYGLGLGMGRYRSHFLAKNFAAVNSDGGT